MWSALLSWVTVGVTVPVIVGIGIGVLSMSPPHYSISQVCFSVSAAILAARLAWWIAFEQSANTTNVQRGLFAFLIFGAIGVLWAVSISWVSGLRPAEASTRGPSLSKRPGKASIYFGEGSSPIGSELPMDQFESGLELKGFAGDREVATLRMKPNGKVTLNVHAAYEGATIEIHDDSFTVQGPNIDKNFGDNEFEVVDPDGLVIFN